MEQKDECHAAKKNLAEMCFDSPGFFVRIAACALSLEGRKAEAINGGKDEWAGSPCAGPEPGGFRG